MPDLEDLVVPESAETIAERMLNLSEDNDLPVTSWHDGAVWKILHNIIPELVSDAFYAIAQIANGVVLGLARGAWLDRVHGPWHDEARTPAAMTVGSITLTDNGGGPHVIAAESVTVSDGTRRFRNVDGGTLTLDGTLTLSFHAVETGNRYNVPNDTITTMVTTLSTVTCNNPEVGSTGTWITTVGADLESDAAFRERMRLKWATLATGSPPAAYLYWALSYSGVTRAVVDDANPYGVNTVGVYIDSSSSVAGLQSWLETEDKIPSGTAVTVALATTETVTIPVIITVTAAYRATAEAEVADNLEDYESEIDIGGIVRQAELIERIMSASGVVDVEFESSWTGAPNVQLGATGIPSLALSATWVEV